MTKEEAIKIGEKLIHEHLNYHWRFGLNKRTGSLGMCWPNERLIEVSEHTVAGGYDLFLSTLLHEIAHAIDFERNGDSDHGPAWKAIMRELGQEPNRVATPEESKAFSASIQYKYDIHCENPECDVHFTRMRKSKAAEGWICSKCSEKGIKSRFIWTKNY